METHTAEDRDRCLEWLVSACRTWLLHKYHKDPASQTNLTLSVPPDLNPDILKHMAYFQGIESILFDLIRLHLLPKDILPPGLISHCEKAYFSTLIQNTRFVELLTQILARTEEKDLPLIALKGMASTARIYKDPGLRPMADIDILCRPSDLKPLADILHTQGFQRRGVLQAHHIAFPHQELGILVEIHFSLQYIVRDKKNLFSQFWEHRQWADMDDARIPILSVEDQLLFDTAHILDHVYRVSLKQFLDFAAWLLLYKEKTDWSYLKSCLIQSGMTEEFVLLNHFLSGFFNIPLDLSAPSDMFSKKIINLKEVVFPSLRDTGFVKTSLAGTRLKSYASLSQKLGFTLSKLFPPFPVIQSTYNTTSSISAFFSYPYHITRTLLDFLSRKKEDTR